MRVVTVAGDVDAESRFATAIAARPGVELAFRCVDRVELLAAIRGAAPDVIVVAGCPTWLDRETCDEAVEARVPMVGLADPGDASNSLAKLGIIVLAEDADPERVLSLTSSEDALPVAPATIARSLEPRGRLGAVWGPKGAPGRSTIAVELAAELAAGEARTVLVDADTYGGDIAQMLGVVEELPTIVWAAQTAARDRADVLRAGLRRAGSEGPVLVPGVNRSDLWRDVRVRAWRELTNLLRDEFAHVVVDAGFCLEEDVTGDGRNAIARDAVSSAESVIAVCRSDPVGLKTFLWAYRGLTEVVDEDRVFVVANRVPAGEETAVADLLRRHAGKRPVAYVPDNPGVFKNAVTRGVAAREVAPSSPVARAVREVAAAIGGRPRQTGVFARLAGRA